MDSNLLSYKDILLRHNKSIVDSRSECDITTDIGNKTFSSPLLASNMKSILNKDICEKFDRRNWFYIYHRIDGPEDVRNFVVLSNIDMWNSVSISVGIGKEWENLVDRISYDGLRVDYFTVDVALSYNDNIIPIVEKIKNKYPKSYLIVGNGCTGEWIQWLENLGVNCAKVGIGVSRSCRTRQYTGFGSSTVSSLIECVNASDKIDIMIDGGITIDENDEPWIGDINKSLVLGADYVMSGAIFSRCIDSPSMLTGYYGNASEMAKGHKKHIEGTCLNIKTNGYTISGMCDLVEDSIKSGLSYAGGKVLSDFRKVKWNILN